MMKTYSEYKDSGVEWLGDVPEHWEAIPLRWYINVMSGSFLSNALFGKDRTKIFDVPVIGGNGVTGFTKTPNINGNVIVIGRVGALCGNVHYINSPAWITDNALIVKDITSFKLDYFYLLLKCMKLNRLANQNAQPLITGTMIKTQHVPLPSAVEQQSISNYLDRKTKQIDTLIEKKQKMIELLKEERTAVINHAVTKGLNPDVKMKDSGIEWLGEVPEHWEVKRLKYLIINSLVNGIFKKKEYFGSGIKLINVFDVYQDDFFVEFEMLERVEVNKSEQIKYSVYNGDIFFVRSSIKLEGVGRSVCAIDVTEPTVFECHVVRARPNQTVINPNFLINFLNSVYAINRFIAVSNMVTMATIDQEKIKSIEIPVPPLPEQKAIANFLNKKTSEIDELITKEKQSIELLQEYRTALISEAVTGKIDVRDEVAA